jgi:hypothetical protein
MVALSHHCHFLETDIAMGEYASKAGYAQRSCAPVFTPCLDRRGTKVVCAHFPTTNVSDLSLDDLLQRLDRHNREKVANHMGHLQKGVKLDFKQIEALEASIPMLQQAFETGGIESVWINADILAGPGQSGGLLTPVHAGRYLDAVAQVPQAVLSIGWTTGLNLMGATYTEEHIRTMTDIANSLVGRDVTFAVNVQMALGSLNELKNLLDEFPENSITVWSSALSSGVSQEVVNELKRELPPERTFWDVHILPAGVMSSCEVQ